MTWSTITYTCDVVNYYSYYQIKIKVNKNLSSPMPSFAKLGEEDIGNFWFCNVVSLHGSKSNVLPRDMCIYIYCKYMRSLRPQVVVFMVKSESKRVVVISALE